MLKGKDILLRQVELGDVDSLYVWENNPESWLVSNTHTPYSKFYLEQYIIGSQNNIYTDRQLRLIIENSTGKVCGAVDLFDFDPHNRRVGIGILVEENSRQKGIGTQALELTIEYARNTLNLHQLYCSIDQDNERSLKLFRKVGFEITGNRKHWTLKANTWSDEFFLQLILNQL